MHFQIFMIHEIRGYLNVPNRILHVGSCFHNVSNKCNIYDILHALEGRAHESFQVLIAQKFFW